MFDAAFHYQRLYAAAPAELSFRGSSPSEWSSWAADLRPRLREALGLQAMAYDLAGHVPRAEKNGAEDMGSWVRESWHLWVEPDVPLPFTLLLPKSAGGRRPLVLTPHGHNHPHVYVGIAANDDERKSIAEGDRDIACQAAAEGYVTIAPTTRGFGETRTEADKQSNALSSCRTQLMHGLLVGRTPIGERVWDISRLIDWAVAREDVDPGRIVITGNSGGGTVSLFAAACDERISVAVPSCCFCTFAGSIGSIRHCDCNYVPGILRLCEMHDIAGLIAPRPFRALAGRDDRIFPIAQVRKAFDGLRRIYEAAGAGDKCSLYVGEGGHRYYKAGAWPFVRQHVG